MIDNKLRYNSAAEYLHFISQFPRAAEPKPGRFYVFSYFFHLNPLYKKYPKLKKYLDFQPYDLCIATRPSKGLFTCINFHALPVKTRQIFMARLRKDYEDRFEQSRTFIPGVNYLKLYRYLKKLGITVRNYRYDRVALLRQVPTEKIPDLQRFYANFYYGTNYRGIVSRYEKYVPKVPES